MVDIKQIWDKDLLYKGFKIVPLRLPSLWYSLSSHEVAQGYKDLKERSLFDLYKAGERLFSGMDNNPLTLLMLLFALIRQNAM